MSAAMIMTRTAITITVTATTATITRTGAWTCGLRAGEC
jgi:hypothetical protein